MANLKTKYLGIELKNPVILGACNLVNNLDNVKRAEDKGVAAIVYKSLFEEQIQLERAQLDDQLEEYADRNAEMTSLFPNIEHSGPEEHLFNLARVKQSVKIPVIASLNAILKDSWVEYAKQIEKVGVDALEINFFYVPKDLSLDGGKVIKDQVSILQAVKESVKIPVSVKLSPFYANPLQVAATMEKAGADGLVLFNRLFQPEIDIEKEEHYAPYDLSNQSDNKLALRFAGLLYGNLKANICSNTGIYTGSDVIKMILAGADCTQVVSTVYKNKIDYIETILKDIEAWMDKKGYASIDDFKGKLSQKSINDPFVYRRAQYIDLLLKSDEVIKKYPVL
ncbi:MAG: dihydroorotate dehydrogenase-like protein [Bacteroidales bacterium]|nr:dihydroorotate dehydrogenase-like protein [Bacteroidales bacterium]MBN2817762.1 dihydroorotate dehydrogenase-like protein [Bacteroidales bacterium]